MTPHGLNNYLIESKTHVESKDIYQIIMGNEAADLDSMASSVIYAYVLSWLTPDRNIIPFIPISRADFKLRTEAVYVFEKAEINPDNLIFLDDVDPKRLMAHVKKIILVDHNRLSLPFEQYADKVAGILDHHMDENLFPDICQKIIEPVGSTATLVGEVLINHHRHLIDEPIALALCGAILLDTVNLNPDTGRAMPKDREIADILLEFCPLSQNDYFKKIQDEKFNVSNLDTLDLIRKDYKVFKFGKIRCGIASVLLPLVNWSVNNNTLGLEIESYAREHGLDILFTMNAYTAPDFTRDLTVYCKNDINHSDIIAYLQNNQLDLTPVVIKGLKPCHTGTISFFRQGNLKISRKKLHPILLSYFNA